MKLFCRNQRGVLYSSLGVAIAAPAIVVLILCIVQCSLFCSAALKLRSLAKQVSLYAANTYEPSGEQTNTESNHLMRTLLKRSGTGATLKSLEISSAKINNDEAVLLQMEVSVPLLSTLPTIPPFMMLKETCSTPLPVNKVCGCVALCPSNSHAQSVSDDSKAIYIPIIRPRKSTVVWAPPLDASLNSLRLVRGNSPLPPDCQFNMLKNDGKTLY